MSSTTPQPLASRSNQPSIFVGRAAEMERLRVALADAEGGQGGVVLLAAEPGIGKTRLAEEVSREAGQRQAQVWWGRCYEGIPALWPWIQMIRAYTCHRAPDALREEMQLSQRGQLPFLAGLACNRETI